MVILDEADRMLDMGFVDDIKNVLSKMPPQRQTVMFSATLPAPIQHLVKSFMRSPVNIRIQDQALTVPNIEQVYYELDRRAKVEVLCRLIDIEDIKFGLIFCATKMMVDELTEHLTARGYAADKLHGDMSQAMRERVMAKFRKRGLEFLVATDVAARGVDVDDIEVVFNYDLPQDSEDYVHRIGRTGRAGRSGKAITFVAGREIWKLQNIMRATKGKIHRARVPSADEVEQKRTSAFYDLIRDTLEGGEYRRHDELIDQLLDQGHTPTDIASALIHLAGGDNKPRPAGERTPEPSSISIPRREDRPERRQDSASEPRFDTFKKKKRAPEIAPADSGDLREIIGKARPKRKSEEEFEPSKVSHEPGMVRLSMNTGRDHEIAPGDIVGVIAGLAKIPKGSIGAIRLLARTTYVDVASEHAPHVLEKLNGIKFKGRNLFISLAE